jgi:hypothetical protein
MNRSTDLFIRRLLKNWAGQYHPPVNSKARLLWEASRITPVVIHRRSCLPVPQFYQPAALRTDDWSQSFFIWVNEHLFQSGLQARIT